MDARTNNLGKVLSVSPKLYEAIVRIVDQRVGEIKVTREDFDNLTRTVPELSGTVQEFLEVQKRTEFNLSKLGERAIRLEAALDRLAEAQKRTEDAVGRLAVAVGGLSDTVGYGGYEGAQRRPVDVRILDSACRLSPRQKPTHMPNRVLPKIGR